MLNTMKNPAGPLAFLLLIAATLAAAAWAEVTIRIDGERVTVEAPADRVTVVDTAPTQPARDAPQTPSADPPANELEGHGGEWTTEGFTVVKPGPESVVIYVAAEGKDTNDGRSPETPFRTLARAMRDTRSFRGDHVLLKAGDVFDGGFGAWNRSGASAEHPALIGVYGEGPRPVVRTQGEGFLELARGGRLKHLVVQGIHAVAVRRNPNDPAYDPENVPYGEGGIVFIGAGEDILIEDCRLDYYGFNLVFQGLERLGPIRGVVIRRCILTQSWKHWDSKQNQGGGHSSGLYTERVEGLRVDQCTFDHNGWNEQAPGGSATKFNHNMYIQQTTRDVEVTRSIIARPSAHGLQLRPGGLAEDNLFWSCPMGMFAPSGAILNNVVIDGRDMTDRPDGVRGQGLMVTRSEQAPVVRIEGNVLARRRSREAWKSAIAIDGPDGKGQSAKASLSGNVVFDWKPEVEGADRSVNGNDTRVLDSLPGIDQYVQGGMPALIEQAVDRPRGRWSVALSAEGFNDYLRVQAGVKTGQ